MSKETMNGMIQEITTESGESIKLDPMFVMESIDDVTALVDANVLILKSVRSIIKRGVANGLTASQASAIALGFQKRAAKKSNELVHYDGEESKVDEDAMDDELKRDIFEARHIPFSTKEKAEEAKEDISRQFNLIRYIKASYTYSFTGKNLSDKSPACWYGWEELPEMDIFEENGKYILELPEPKKLSESKGVKRIKD